MTPEQRIGAPGQSDPIQPDLLDKRILRPNELAPRRRRVLDKLQLVAGPGANVGLKARQSFMQVGRLEVVDHDQTVDVRVAVGVAASDGPEEPGAVEVGPCGQSFAQSPEAQNRPRGR